MDESADVLLALAVANPVQLTSREVQRYQCDTLDALALTALLRQCIAAKVPAVLTGCVAHWPALRRWDDVYLRRVLSDAPVHVAQTPDGLADAIATLPSGERVFAKPFETVMPFSLFACEKCFTLLPPQEGQLLRREPVRAATYVPAPNSRGRGPSVGLELQVDDDAEAVVYWATVALDSQDAAPLQPLRVVLGPGELLVLPSLWWHHVSQRARSDDGGRCSATVAVNYWYDNG